MAEDSKAEAESYRILGVRPGASAKEIRVAFRQQAMLHHPDRNPGNSAAEERFREVLKAYQIALRSIEQQAKVSAPEAEAAHGRPRHASAGDTVYRSRSSANRAVSRFLLFLLFTVGPMLFILFVIWANTSTDWIPGCCPEIRIEEESGPFERPRREEPEAPLEELAPALDRD